MKGWSKLLTSCICTIAFTFAAAHTTTSDRTVISVNTVLAPLRAVYGTPNSDIDLAKAKLTIDHMIDPTIDVGHTLHVIDAMAAQARTQMPSNAGRRASVVALLTYLYRPGAFNDGKPFRYDLDDPFGHDLHNKLLSTYLATRKGNCVSMPILFVILAQKLGLDATLSMAPMHFFVKVRDDDGSWLNVENTSGGTKTDVGYQHDFAITDQAIQSGIYLRALNQREDVAAMTDTLMEFYGEQNQQELRIATARLALRADARDVGAMLHQAAAYQKLIKQRYANRYSSLSEMTKDQVDDYQFLDRSMRKWGQRAESLGWRENKPAADAAYEQKIQRVKSLQGKQ